MAPLTFHLITLKSDISEESLLSAARSHPEQDRPIYIGKCQHWIHSPTLSVEALYNDGKQVKRWDYLLITLSSSLDIAGGIEAHVADKWSIGSAMGDETMINNYKQTRQTPLSTPAPPLPSGWSPADQSGLDASVPPPDLEASLALQSYPLGSNINDNAKPTSLQKWTGTFGSQHTGPVCMLNLLAYVPGGRERYAQYREAFAASVGSKYGGSAMFLGIEVTDWSSKGSNEEAKEENLWKDAALVGYPSIWHFAKMLDDPGYADADRKFKQGSLRDNPILCCTEVDVGYED